MEGRKETETILTLNLAHHLPRILRAAGHEHLDLSVASHRPDNITRADLRDGLAATIAHADAGGTREAATIVGSLRCVAHVCGRIIPNCRNLLLREASLLTRGHRRHQGDKGILALTEDCLKECTTAHNQAARVLEVQRTLTLENRTEVGARIMLAPPRPETRSHANLTLGGICGCNIKQKLLRLLACSRRKAICKNSESISSTRGLVHACELDRS